MGKALRSAKNCLDFRLSFFWQSKATYFIHLIICDTASWSGPVGKDKDKN